MLISLVLSNNNTHMPTLRMRVKASGKSLTKKAGKKVKKAVKKVVKKAKRY